MVNFPVTEEKRRLLLSRMSELGVQESDLKESFILSSGERGQHVNKTATCVHLVHLPTGLEVKCMRERSQAMNRLARRELLRKIAAGMGIPTQKVREAERKKAAEGTATEKKGTKERTA